MTVSKIEHGENPWLSAARPVLPWAIPATLSLYIKYRMLENWDHGGYVVAARSLGRDTLSQWDRFSFFRADLLVTFLLVPLGFLLVSRYLLPRRSRTPFFVLFSLVSVIVLYLEFCAFDATGQFLSLHVLSAAINWGLFQDRSAIFTYWHVKTLVALVGMAAVMSAWSWQANRRRRRGNSIAVRRWYISAAVMQSCLVTVTIAAWASPFPATPFHKNVVGWILRSLAGRTETHTREFVGLPGLELQSRYSAMTSSSTAGRDARYWAKAKGCNVLFFVLETAPARVLPADGDLADFPNLRRLREKSLVGVSHYTTYPSTHEALFSILSSWYPSTAASRLQSRQPKLAVSGIIGALSNLGYDTALYSSIDSDAEPDTQMYKSLGFQRQVYPPRESDTLVPIFDGNESARARMALDVATVSLLKADLERDLTEGRRFAYLFEPEVSHGPWADLKENGKEQNVARRGRNILEISDQLLGEIMEVLQRHNQLENTVIVVVGDHGIRSRFEDPALPGGVVDDYSFHVPLVIYAPKAFDHMEEIPWVTSHIDIAPSVRSLLGIEEGQSFEQGTPIWDPNLVNRTTFFFAHDLMGVDGYYSRGQFFMWNQMSDAVYQNTQMSFDGINFVPRNSSAYDEVTNTINRMAGLNEVWAMHLSDTGAPHSFLALGSKP